MAHYVVRIRTPLSPGVVFAFMADLTNFERWDPGVVRAAQVSGVRPGPDAAYDVTVKGMRKPLRYVTNEYEAPTRVVVQAHTRMLTSLDAITVEPDDEGAVVTYDARLTLNGPLGMADGILAGAFGRIAARAADGLVQALSGTRLEPVAA
jgi:Polyketide cyclase / dehydrase and lipid transport